MAIVIDRNVSWPEGWYIADCKICNKTYTGEKRTPMCYKCWLEKESRDIKNNLGSNI